MATAKKITATAKAAAEAIEAIAAPSKIEAGYVGDIVTKMQGVDQSAKALMVAVHQLACKVGSARAAQLAEFAAERAYPDGVPRQRVSQIKQFCGLPEKQRATLCEHFGSIATAAINRATVTADGTYIAPEKKGRAPKTPEGPAPKTAAPATAIKAALTMLGSVDKAQLGKARAAMLDAIIADLGDLVALSK